MDYPFLLKPTLTESFSISSGTVNIPKCEPHFEMWNEPINLDNYGGKAILNYNGRPAFAELFILWSFLDNGWDGVWVDSFHRKFWKDYWKAEQLPSLPDRPKRLIEQITGHTKFPIGCWDVICWRGNEIIFIESKRHKRDQMRTTQIKWLDLAMEAGISEESFLVVEWLLANE